jgi:hypothetical protein
MKQFSSYLYKFCVSSIMLLLVMGNTASIVFAQESPIIHESDAGGKGRSDVDPAVRVKDQDHKTSPPQRVRGEDARLPADEGVGQEALLPPNNNPVPDFLSRTPKAKGGALDRVQAGNQTGSFQYSYPIAVPPGRSGIEPSLELNYDSSSRDNESTVGYGWSLSIPSIERANKKGTDHMYNSSDTALVSMAPAVMMDLF